MLCHALPALAGDAIGAAAAPWWIWPIGLFVACFALGVVAVPAGIGGGTLFVPIVSGLFPFHLDFVRGAGLLVALASALAAGPTLLRSGLASLRLALPLAVLTAAASTVGASLGLLLPPRLVQGLLGAVVIGIVALMLLARSTEFPAVSAEDRFARLLHLQGVFTDRATGRARAWRTHRSGAGALAFTVIGLLGGMFGIGAGWANVPALNLLMGAPVKVAAGTSSIVLSLASSSAAFVYLNQGAVLAIVAVPSVVGMMLGARLGARLLGVLNATAVRRIVIALLLFAGVRALLAASGIGR